VSARVLSVNRDTMDGMNLTGVVLLLIGLAAGAAIGALWVRSRLGAEVAELKAGRQAALDRAEYTEQAQQRLSDQFRALSADALQRSNAQFLELADTRFKAAELPIKDSLERLDVRLREIEHTRVSAQAALAQQIEQVRLTGEHLRKETASLVTALRKPQVRGQWGEMHLRRAVEIAGLVERCDFDTQFSVGGADGVHRPDMVVHLAGGKHVVVDAKVPLQAFLEAAEAADEDSRRERLTAHARHLRTHVDQLSGKAYWQRLSPTPEFVVLFVPGEAFLAPALESDPTLLEHAAGRKIVIATPSTLIALLRTVAFAWTQDALADNAREVFELGRELYSRLGSLGDHVDRLGRSLTSAVGAYNKTVGSLEARVLVSARRLRDLKVVEDELASPNQVEETPRALSSPELAASAEEARQIRALPVLGDALLFGHHDADGGGATTPGTAAG
jgi:DNA recombination protein RmuC